MFRPTRLAGVMVASTLFYAMPCLAQVPSVIPELDRVADCKVWKISNAVAEALQVDGKQAVRLKAQGDSADGFVGLALVNGLEFSTGIIEIDLKGNNVRQGSFLGVAFNVSDDKTFEGVYFRPFNFKADEPFRNRAVQYIAWPANTWEKLRKGQPGKFEASIHPLPDPENWFHARIEVGEKQVRVFVNDAQEPSLVVERLAAQDRRRPAGLFVDVAEGLYANLKLTQVIRQ